MNNKNVKCLYNDTGEARVRERERKLEDWTPFLTALTAGKQF